MKPQSFGRQLAIAIVVCMFFTAFTTPKTLPAPSSTTCDNTHYYFYLTDDDSYDAYKTVSDEIVHLQGIYGVTVNTSSFGGTLVAQGYLNNIYPHQIWPSSYLYAHF